MKVDVMECPSQSPELKTIEHLWEHLGRQLPGKMDKKKTEKFEQLEEVWKNILSRLSTLFWTRCRGDTRL